jgi:proliferating cell nuclear antigen
VTAAAAAVARDDELLAVPPADEELEDGVDVELRPGVVGCALKFALRYLDKFGKAAPVSGTVKLRLSPLVPLVVEYPMPAGGRLAFYLAQMEDENKPIPRPP